MPETRSQTQRGQQGAGRPRAGRSRARSGLMAQASSRTNAPIHSRSGLLYDIQNLSPSSAQRATEGFSSEYFVDRSRSHRTSQGTYYAFQLKKPVSVRIHDPANGNKVECTCEEYQNSKSACVHIYWLFDGLSAVLVQNSGAAMQTVTQGGVVDQLSELYELIGERLESLPDQLNRTRGDEAESDSGQSGTEETYPSSNPDFCKETVLDMLSVFDRNALPSEYGVEFPKKASASAFGTDPYVPENLAATIYGVATRDEKFFGRLRKVITRDICAKSYFSKQLGKAKELMAHLDRFAESDPSKPVGAKDVNVPVCARGLRLIVHDIFENRYARTAREPLGFEVISKAAETLINILYEVVCRRNIDISGRIPRDGVADDDERANNLFKYLISNPPRFDSTFPIAMKDDFIIDRLRDFPAAEWCDHLERLTTIVDYIHEHAPMEERATAYAAKLKSMIREYTTEAFEPSSSSVQQRSSSPVRRRRRPTVGSPRESQRRRFG